MPPESRALSPEVVDQGGVSKTSQSLKEPPPRAWFHGSRDVEAAPQPLGRLQRMLGGVAAVLPETPRFTPLKKALQHHAGGGEAKEREREVLLASNKSYRSDLMTLNPHIEHQDRAMNALYTELEGLKTTLFDERKHLARFSPSGCDDFCLQPRPESGLDCLACSEFDRQRQG